MDLGDDGRRRLVLGDAAIAAEELSYGSIGGCLGIGQAAGRQIGEPPLPQTVAKFIKQTGLAQARLPDKHHHLPPPGLRMRQRGLPGDEFLLTADEGAQGPSAPAPHRRATRAAAKNPIHCGRQARQRIGAVVARRTIHRTSRAVASLHRNMPLGRRLRGPPRASRSRRPPPGLRPPRGSDRPPPRPHAHERPRRGHSISCGGAPIAAVAGAPGLPTPRAGRDPPASPAGQTRPAPARPLQAGRPRHIARLMSDQVMKYPHPLVEGIEVSRRTRPWRGAQATAQHGPKRRPVRF